MEWNLVNHLSRGAKRRAFYPPLASLPPGKLTISAVDRTKFFVAPVVPANAAGVTTDMPLNIWITPPGGGFIDEAPSGLTDPDDGFVDSFALPNSLIRLHAIGNAKVRYKPVDATHGKLLLELAVFLLAPSASPKLNVMKMPPWWRQWLSAGCIPTNVIYENVDFASVQQMLNQVKAPVDTTFENRVAPTYGVWFPAEVTASDKNAFITQFLAGNDDKYFVCARAGAFLGAAAQAPARTDSLLTLHVTYKDHTPATPHPMNPLELFNLLFGDKSAEADITGPAPHPLLQRINELGQAADQNSFNPRTKRTLLRPPLRTSARAEWEAELEYTNDPAAWGIAGSLGTTRLFNDHVRGAQHFNRDAYVGWKCNIFVSDICLRSGFRVCVTTAKPTTLHYATANTYCLHVEKVQIGLSNPDLVPLLGTGEDEIVSWGWKIEGWVRAAPGGNFGQRIAEAINSEGRCMVLFCGAPRGFGIPENQVPPNQIAAASCVATNIRWQSGHVRLITRTSTSAASPSQFNTIGKGLAAITVATYEAGKDALLHIKGKRFRSGAPDYVRLHLVELCPGKDPDTLQGLRDLNVRNSYVDKPPSDSDWAARDVPILGDTTHVCHDNFPAAGATIN